MRRLLLCVALVGCSDAPEPAQDSTGSDGTTATPSGTPSADPATGQASDSAGVGSSGEAGSSSSGEPTPPDPNGVVRVQVDWDGADYVLGAIKLESSGTEALARRATSDDALGSFVGVLADPDTGDDVYQQSIGTGFLYRELARGITFRFPAFAEPLHFTMLAENDVTGELEVAIEAELDPAELDPVAPQEVSVTAIRDAEQTPALRVVLYAEGYLSGTEDAFLADADRLVQVLEEANFPGLPFMAFEAVFAPSNQPLGVAAHQGLPVPVWDSFLGLYHPYWSSFSRWFHVVYPTDEALFRDALGQVPYDYPVIITDSSEFWGTGNYNAYTVVPARNESFAYLVLHELGHFFGLNEEYSTQDTELLFAPAIAEPWSQNMTFQREVEAIKWNAQIADDVPVPTPSAQYPTHGVGAYAGGYAGEDPDSLIPVPDGICTMSSGIQFCPVCASAILDKVEFDLAG